MSCLMINDLDAGVGRFGGLSFVHDYFLETVHFTSYMLFGKLYLQG
jgi:hypothetical protein